MCNFHCHTYLPYRLIFLSYLLFLFQRFPDFEYFQQQIQQLKQQLETERAEKMALEHSLMEVTTRFNRDKSNSDTSFIPKSYLEHQSKRKNELCKTCDGDVYLQTDIGLAHDKNKKFMEVCKRVFPIHLIFLSLFIHNFLYNYK